LIGPPHSLTHITLFRKHAYNHAIDIIYEKNPTLVFSEQCCSKSLLMVLSTCADTVQLPVQPFILDRAQASSETVSNFCMEED